MLKLIKAILKRKSHNWVLVANITKERLWTDPKSGVREFRSGTKHFKPNAKVFCNIPIGFWQWDEEFGVMEVLGRHRKSGKWICVHTRLSSLCNFRVKKEYSPSNLKRLKEKYKFSTIDYKNHDLDGLAESGNLMANHTKDMYKRKTSNV